MDNNSSKDYNISTHIIKGPEFLPKKIEQGILIPFVVNENDEYLF